MAFQIAKRVWLRRTISAASLALTALTTYHQYTTHSRQTQEQMDRSDATALSNEGDSADRAPSSVHALTESNPNYRSSDEVFPSRSNEGATQENNSEEQNNGKPAGVEEGTSQISPAGIQQTGHFNPAHNGTPSSAGGSNTPTAESAPSGASAGSSTAYQSAAGYSANPTPAASPVFGTVAVSQSVGITPTGPSPGVTSITPPGGSSAGGTSVTITGSNFRSGDSVSLGGSQCLSVQIDSPTQLTCTTTFHSSQSVNVTVADPDGISSMLAAAYDYQPGAAVQVVSFAGSSKTGAFGDVETVSITQETSVIISP